MKFNELKDKLNPFISKTLSHTLQGYIFGTMVGIVTNKESCNKKFITNINNTGLKFAKVGFVYSTIDSVANEVWKSKYNATVTGMLTGVVVGKNKIASGIGLGCYSALVDYYNKKEQAE